MLLIKLLLTLELGVVTEPFVEGVVTAWLMFRLETESADEASVPEEGLVWSPTDKEKTESNLDNGQSLVMSSESLIAYLLIIPSEHGTTDCVQSTLVSTSPVIIQTTVIKTEQRIHIYNSSRESYVTVHTFPQRSSAAF